MNAPKRNRARVLTPDGLKKLREQLRSHEVDQNAGFKYTLERLGELTGLDPETVKNVLDCKGSDKRTIARCFESFGLTLADGDHILATQASVITADPNFVGRDEAIADLNALVSRNAKVIVIQARGGVGKTTLARKYLQQEFGSFLEFPIAKETKDIASIEGLIEEKLRQLNEEPGREFWVSLDRLKRKLQAERIGVLIDNLEPALDSAGKFIEAHRRYVELLRVLSDPIVQSTTLITSRERLREADVTVQHYSLRSLDVQAWEQFFQSRSINTESPALAALHNAYGGNAKAMDIISGAVLEDFSGDVEAYWQANQDDLFIERDLEDLVTKQFDRLQQLDPDAYKLLCRMGCYRYQDVPTVPIEGLFCLLWDVPENRHRRVIKSLQDRSLVDFEDGEFWLHPVVREEAISRLRINDDWETTNCKAAEFWTISVQKIETMREAIKASEAFHHYILLNDFEAASNVILGRDNNGNYLGRSLYRVGLFQATISKINQLIDNLDTGVTLGRLYYLLSGLCRLVGDWRMSIKCADKLQEIAIELKDDYFKIVSLQNIGLAKMNLLEVEEAIEIFEKTICMVGDIANSQKHIVTAWFCLASLYSYLDGNEFKKKAYEFAENSSKSLLEKIDLSIWREGFGYVCLGLAYKNIGDYLKSHEMYKRAIHFALSSNFSQISAIALCGLAELSREAQNFKEALLKCIEAIELLDKIGAKFSLAEAYYQLGLTYQATDETGKSNESFQEAVRLFSEMEAPKQVERVRRSMQN